MSPDMILFAAASGLDAQDVRPMHDAIVRGWARGPVGVMDELALEGITTERLDRISDLEDDLAYAQADLKEADAHIAELERETEDDDTTIEALREEITVLHVQLRGLGAEPAA